MATGTSVVGSWNPSFDWGCGSTPITTYTFVFNSNGTWTYPNGGGRWLQVEGMVFWNFDNAPGLVYAANLTKDAMVGVMGYPTTSPQSGCFYAIRHVTTAAAAAVPSSHDIALKPHK